MPFIPLDFSLNFVIFAKPYCFFSNHHPLQSLFLLSWTFQVASMCTTRWFNTNMRQVKAKPSRPQAIQLFLCTSVLEPWLVAIPQLTLNPCPSTIKQVNIQVAKSPCNPYIYIYQRSYIHILVMDLNRIGVLKCFASCQQLSCQGSLCEVT